MYYLELGERLIWYSRWGERLDGSLAGYVRADKSGSSIRTERSIPQLGSPILLQPFLIEWTRNNAPCPNRLSSMSLSNREYKILPLETIQAIKLLLVI